MFSTSTFFFSAEGAAFLADTLNPADKATQITLSNGNLTATNSTAASLWRSVRAVTGKSSGKYYFEFFIDQLNATSNFDMMVGVATTVPTVNNWLGNDAQGWQYADNGNKGNGGTLTAHGAAFNTGNTVNIALDLDAGKIWFGVNGTFTGDPVAGTGEAFSGITGTIYPGISHFVGTGSAGTKIASFVSDPVNLVYPAPSGFTAGWSQ